MDGDTILVHPGEYLENIDLEGKNIVIGSLFLTTMDYSYVLQTILNGDSSGSVVMFHNGESEDAMLSGFTITNGSGYNKIPKFPELLYGGGIYISNNSSPILEYLIINENSSGHGSGIFISGSGSPIINHVTITNNVGASGMSCSGNSNLILRNVIISDNQGHGITCEPNSTLLLENVVITNNENFAIYCHGGDTNIINSILWNNGSGSILFADDSYHSTVTVAYSNVEGGEGKIITYTYDTLNWFDGNIDVDPLFLDPENKNYSLREGSLCIDAGTPDTLYNDSCFPPGMGSIRNDMGAFGGPYNCQNMAVHAEFTVDTTYGDAPLIVKVTDLSTSINTSVNYWLWNFGDGSTSNEQSPVHTYAEGGIYTVTLTVGGSDGDIDSETKDDLVWVVGNRFVIVPRDKPTIQSAIDFVSFGDTILVEPGIYEECINFNGKNIIIGSKFMTTGDTSYISQTIIHATNQEKLVTFENGEDSSALLCGFTLISLPLNTDGQGIYIKNASPILSHLFIKEDNSYYNLKKSLIYGGAGGGIYFENSHSMVSNVYITQNVVMIGGGIYAINSNLQFNNVYIYGNKVIGGGNSFIAHGAGIASIFSNLIIRNSLIANNIGSGVYVYGGGIYSSESTIRLINVTISNNDISCYSSSSGSAFGGGLYLNVNSRMEVINSILWNNGPEEIYISGSCDSCSIVIGYSDLDGGADSIVTNNTDNVFWLDDNFYEDPLFADTAKVDYCLMEGSPCIDAGVQNTYFVYNNNQDTLFVPMMIYNGSAPDLGAFEYDNITGIREKLSFPESILLYQNYPNPFNLETTITFHLPKTSNVEIKIYNIYGQEIKTLLNQTKKAGTHKLVWTGTNNFGEYVSSGIYIVHLLTLDFKKSIKTILLK